MGWFDEQIRQRKAADDEVFSDSFAKMASSVTGRHATGLGGEHAATEEAVNEILRYCHCKGRLRQIPDSVTDIYGELEYLLRPFGIMYREITLKDKWYKEAVGAILAFDSEKDTPVALIPSGLSGYSYSNTGGKKIKVNRKNAKNFRDKALCFYRPLPLRKIGLTDFINYIKDCLNLKDIFLLAVLVISVTVLGMLTTQLTRVMTGTVLNSRNISMLLGLLCFMICTAGSSALITSVRELVVNKVYVKISASVEAAFMMRILSLPPLFFRKYSAGELAERAQMATRICDILLEFGFCAVLGIFMAVFYLVQFSFFAGKLVFPAFSVLLVMALVTALTTVLQVKRSKQIMELSAKESGISIALMSGIQKIRLAGAEKRAFAKWADIFSEQTSLTYNLPMLLKLNGGSAILPSSSGRYNQQNPQEIQRTFLSIAVMLAGNLMFYYTAASNGMIPSDYFAFNAAFGMIIAAFNLMAANALKIAQLNPMLSMIEPVLTTIPEISEDKKILPKLSGNIELNNVCFRYSENTPYVINSLSLKIHSGEYIAVVGRTGCGKSTLLRLLLGFEKPEKGAVYYDGTDLSTVDLKSLRRMIGTVMQDGRLFQGNIYSNIVISSPKLTIDDAWKAAELAGIADDIRAMPMGMHTLINEGGGGISGGQRQRLMIARAIAPKPQILMFDEATSALDNITQKTVAESLASLKCTRIVIAHRLSTVQNCDRILVLDGGRIIEEGNYETLVKNKGVFASLVERQQI